MRTLFRWGRQVWLEVKRPLTLLLAIYILTIVTLDPRSMSVKTPVGELHYEAQCEVQKTQ